MTLRVCMPLNVSHCITNLVVQGLDDTHKNFLLKNAFVSVKDSFDFFD